MTKSKKYTTKPSIEPKAVEVFNSYNDDPTAYKEEGAASKTAIKNIATIKRCQFENAAIEWCESPIEQIMLACLFRPSISYLKYAIEIEDTTLSQTPTVADMVIIPQFTILNCRVDFAIIIRGENSFKKIVVECDGHDFHEKTKEQAKRDRRRDRDLQMEGWVVLRFTGSEIWNDPEMCADDISEFIDLYLEDGLVKAGKI